MSTAATRNKLKSLSKSPLPYVGLLAIAAAIWGAAMLVKDPSTKPVATAKNVVLVVVDAMRPDHLGTYGYATDTSPFLDRLAKEGTVVERVYSNAPWTKPAVASILTGMFPSENVDTVNGTLAEETVTLSEVLKRHGFRTAYINGGNRFIGKHYNFHQGFDHYACVDEEKGAAAVIKEWKRLLPELKGKRFFAYLHFMDPHLPYHENRYYDEIVDGDHKRELEMNPQTIRKLTAQGRVSAELRRALTSRYDAQIRWVDHNLRELHSQLQEAGLVEDTVLIVTADHGEELWEHGSFEHGHTLYEEVVRVPLILHGRPFPSSRLEGPIQLSDLFPTILQTLGVPVPECSGLGHFRQLSAGVDTNHWPVYLTGVLYGAEKYGIIDGRYKWIKSTKNKEGKFKRLFGRKTEGPVELYDLKRDPGESHDLHAKVPRSKLARFNRKLERILDRGGMLAGKSEEMTEEVREELESLGYIQETL